MSNIKIEQLTLEDGRRAERHTSIDGEGNEVVEMFVEEKQPLKLEKRIKREFKRVVAKETHETVKDGNVSEQIVKSLEADRPLEVRSHIAVADHAKVIDGEYVRKEDLSKVVAEAVVAGVSVLAEQMQPSKPAPLFSAQSVVEKNVEEKKKGNNIATTIILGVIVAVQIAFVAYLWYM